MANPKDSKSGKDKKGGLLSSLVAILLVSICSGGIGFLSGTRALQLLSADASASQSLAVAKTSAVSMQLVTLPAIITNLSGSDGGWVRLEAVVLVDGTSAVPPDLAARLAQDTTALLRTLSIRQISGATGFQHLRQELMDRMKTRSSDRVREIMIQSLVIE